MSRLFRILGHIWLGLLGLSIIAGIAGMYVVEPTFYDFWIRFTDTFSPFNLINYLLIAVLALPAICFYKLSDYLARTNNMGVGK